MPSQLFLDQILIYKKKKKSKGWHRKKTVPKFPHKLSFLMSTASVVHVCSSFISWLEYLIYIYIMNIEEKIVEEWAELLPCIN